jgi:alkanesulfonate monooxygenase SsuD/methylene tetrahydromethanopterin reductase-like flavin-dependent oxidoreductase (luciferase family)
MAPHSTSGHSPMAGGPGASEWFTAREDQGRPIGFTQALANLVASEGLSARQIVRRTGPAGGHRLLVGTPQEVADDILDWWSSGAVAGFNVHVPLLHEDLERFIDQVVPILQAEGAYPREYDGATIRDRFDLPYPQPRPHVSAATTAIPA